MKAILTSIYCIPCIWSLLAVLGTGGIFSYIMNVWVPFRGPMPSDGEAEGFPSKAARIDYFDTRPLRVRTAFKFATIGIIVGLTGLVVSYAILSSINSVPVTPVSIPAS